MDYVILFYILLFVVAFFYASVGHGGASGYLALMAIFSVTPEIMKPTALMLNLFVSMVSFTQFYRGKHFDKRIFFPLALASIPLSFIGGLMVIDGDLYKKILGILLIVPIVRFLFFANANVTTARKNNWILSLVIGGLIGLLSGMIGIGGGILLSPVLLFLKWTDQKKTAAISALFIFVNSLAGLIGQLTKGVVFSTDMFIYVVVAFVGGLFGAYYGALKFNQTVLKNILATVLMLAVYKLLITHV